MNKQSPRIGVCPDCGADIRFQKAPYVGQVKICSSCGTELEVVAKSPIELDYAFDDPLYEDDEYGDDPYEDYYDEDYDDWTEEGEPN